MKRKFKVGRLVRMHSNTMEDINEARCGDIVALFGIDCASGDTFCDPSLNLSMTSMYVPNAVISLSITPKDKSASDKMAKALNRFTKEDPTFRTHVDPESNETNHFRYGRASSGSIHRAYEARVQGGSGNRCNPVLPTVKPSPPSADFNYTHKKADRWFRSVPRRVAGFMEVLEVGEDGKDYEFVDMIKGGSIPNEYIPSCDKGFQEAMKKGSLIGAPVVGVKMTINDGQYHTVDSSDQAFQTAALGAFREAYNKAKPVILEPIMKVSVEGPSEFQGKYLRLHQPETGHDHRFPPKKAITALWTRKFLSAKCSVTPPFCGPPPRVRRSSPWNSPNTVKSPRVFLKS